MAGVAEGLSTSVPAGPKLIPVPRPQKDVTLCQPPGRLPAASGNELQSRSQGDTGRLEASKERLCLGWRDTVILPSPLCPPPELQDRDPDNAKEFLLHSQ